MQRLEVSGAVRPIYGSLGVIQLTKTTKPEVRKIQIVPRSKHSPSQSRKSFVVEGNSRCFWRAPYETQMCCVDGKWNFRILNPEVQNVIVGLLKVQRVRYVGS